VWISRCKRGAGSLSLPCPGNCRVTDKQGKDLGPGMLHQTDADSPRYFCTTPGCKFAYHNIDTKKDEWVGGEAPLDILVGEQNDP